MDDRRLPRDAGRAHPARRVARRPVRTPAHLLARSRVVRGRVVAVWHRTEHRRADRGPHASGRRRRAADPGQPRHHPGHVPSRRPRPGHRRVVGARRDRDGGRTPGRRLAGRRGELAGDLPPQPPAGRDRRRGRAASRSREHRSVSERARRHRRRDAHRARPGRRDVRPHRGVMGPGPARSRGTRGVRRVRAARVAPDAAARHLRVAPIHGGQRRDVRDLRLARRSLLPVRRLPPDVAALLAVESGRGVAADHAADAHAVVEGRRAGPANRPAPTDDVRAVDRRARHPRFFADQPGRPLRDVGAAGGRRVRPRPVAHRRATDRDGSGRPTSATPAWHRA